jgi:hypothetical protein
VDLLDLEVTSSMALPPTATQIALDGQAEYLYYGWSDLSASPQVGTLSRLRLDCILAPPDADNDGIPDDIDSDGGAGTSSPGFSDDTGNGHITSGELSSGTVTVADAADPKGVRITATSNAVLSARYRVMARSRRRLVS